MPFSGRSVAGELLRRLNEGETTLSSFTKPKAYTDGDRRAGFYFK
jgi:hypothetical protein